MWPVSLDRAGIVPFASLLSHTGRQLRRLPPRLRRSWCRSIRKLPALTVAVRALDRRYAWLSLTVAVLSAPGAITLAALAATPAGTSTKPTVVTPAAPGRRAPENLAVASARSAPQAGAALAAATSTPDRGSATTVSTGPLVGTPKVAPVRSGSAVPIPTALPPFRPMLSKLTPDGCCASFLWADDSIHVLYYDRRNPDATGTWLVNVETGEELLLLPLYGYFSPDRSMVAVPEPDTRQMRFRQLATDEEWVVPNLPSRVLFDPSGERIAFTLRPGERPLARGAVGRSPQGVARILGPIAVWIADVRGTEARVLATLPGARIHGWLPDGSALLVTWRTVGKLETSLGLLDLETGDVALLATAPRLLSGRLSPDGEWVAYVAAFTGDLQRDGLWVQRVRGDEARRLIIWGDYRWAPDSASLIVLPPRPKGTDGDRFWRLYVDGEFPVPLTDPAETPFAITNNSWDLSTDGERIVFTSAADHSLWLLRLRP